MQGSARNLLREFEEGKLVPALAAHVGVRYRPDEEHGEIGAWRRSVPALLGLLCDCGLGDLQVILEYQLPYSPKRVDALLCGVHPETGLPAYVLVELKQWENAKVVGRGLVRYNKRKGQPVLHPAEQVRRYCLHLLGFVPALARTPSCVKGLAYLHNAHRGDDWQLDDFECDDYSRLYTADQLGDLATDLVTSLRAADDAADRLTRARRAPARALLIAAAGSVTARTDFVLLDEQQVAFEAVRGAVADAFGNGGGRKKVVLVRGGPGTGKSAIALNLYSAMARREVKVVHATGSKAMTETLRRSVFRENQRQGEDVFKYFNNFARARQNELDVVICDEAHRLRGQANVPERWRGRLRGQIHQLIDAAKVPVFLLDDHQVVRPGEIGSPRDVLEIAKAMDCQVVEVNLDGQFRCGGSPLFDQWVQRLLGLAEEAPVSWSDLVADTDDEYVVESVEAPHALEAWLRARTRDTKTDARIAAGFCWKWKPPVEKNGKLSLADDVRIGGWHRPWNAWPDVEVPDVPATSFWASDPKGFNQVGCIYTAQGFEYDWAGVIMGEDLVIRDGQWVAQHDHTEDPALKETTGKRFDRLVRNAYKVLLTRGMQGVCVYSADPETNDFLRKHTA
ncbi:DNA/RNA helicase domain-containing protein [Amycolatopsis sp. NPDC088138]|uniref:DNA/RNA helicase domain-containing protein n=1 Tax=Amycolatopsis sp. NPDC088138 TaxID=3363938 RepID=UPI00381CFCC1